MSLYRTLVYPHIVTMLGNPRPYKRFVSKSFLWRRAQSLKSASGPA